MKARIINKLKSEDSPLSARQLMADLDLSETSLHQHIHDLRRMGYPISESKGIYGLTTEPDVLFPWEFNERQSRIRYFPEVSSTMDIARAMAKDNCPHFTVIIADQQTKGRGRLKRTWISKTGGLYFTIVLRPDLPIAKSHLVNFGASLCLARVLHTHFGLNAKVKWPNDIFVDGKKISGLLSEMDTDEDRTTFINIGIGINVNNDPSIDEPNANSLKQLLGKSVLRKKILSAFLDEFESLLRHANTKDIIHQWKQWSMTLGKTVRIVTNREITEGTAVDVDENGALILRLTDNTMKTIIYGDCFNR